MNRPKEDKTCYASPEQRKVLVEITQTGILDSDFFLTGGTALAVFYLHHRVSNDLDLFTTRDVNLAEIDFTIKTQWRQSYHKIKDSQTFLSILLHDVKVDFVIDPQSSLETRPTYQLEANSYIRIDSISNILSNKLTTLVSRTEPKDFVDFYYLSRSFQVNQLESIYQNASKKDTIFDDSPTVAYQIEQGLSFLLNNLSLLPLLKVQLDQVAFTEFYHKLISWVYNKAAPI